MRCRAALSDTLFFTISVKTATPAASPPTDFCAARAAGAVPLRSTAPAARARTKATSKTKSTATTTALGRLRIHRYGQAPCDNPKNAFPLQVKVINLVTLWK
jgi:hypothetical protein